MKKSYYTELAYVTGMLSLALGTAFMERANFGMSMVVAPAYLVYLKVSSYFSWFTFGMAEYCFQLLLIIILSLVLFKFKRKFLFSFVTAVLYGNVLDIMMKIVGYIPDGGFPQRIFFYILGLLLGSLGVSLFFHTYITPEAYELFVKEISDKYGKDIHVVKTIYDCCSCIVAIMMSFIFIGFFKFEGVKFGTIICAICNGFIIGKFTHFLEKRFTFKDALNLRRYFE